MREVVEKIMNSVESDVLTESVQRTVPMISRLRESYQSDEPKRAEAVERKDRKPSREPVSGEVKTRTVVASLARVARSGESGQGDGATLAGGKENLIPPMLLAGLTTTAAKLKKNAQTLADIELEMEVISQCGYGGLDDYKPSRTNMARMKLEGQLDVVEYSRITVPDSVHVGDPAGGYVEMLKARNSARGHLMA